MFVELILEVRGDAIIPKATRIEFGCEMGMVLTWEKKKIRIMKGFWGIMDGRCSGIFCRV